MVDKADVAAGLREVARIIEEESGEFETTKELFDHVALRLLRIADEAATQILNDIAVSRSAPTSEAHEKTPPAAPG